MHRALPSCREARSPRAVERPQRGFRRPQGAAAAGRCVDIGRVSRRGLAVRVALRLVVDRPALTREEKAPASFGPGPSCLSHPSSRERRVPNSTSLHRLDHPRHGRRSPRMPVERVGGKLLGRYKAVLARGPSASRRRPSGRVWFDGGQPLMPGKPSAGTAVHRCRQEQYRR